MGSGIAHVAALGGYETRLFDPAPEAVGGAMDAIKRNLGRQARKGTISQDQAAKALAGIAPAATLREAARGVRVAIEAAPEDATVKKTLFRELDRVCGSDAALASNTSSISITRIAGWTRRPGRVVGIHFMNPVPMMRLVEVVRGLQTSEATSDFAIEFSKSLGKTPVVVNDSPGFVANRILAPMINEAVQALMEGVGDAKAIDDIMKMGMGHPMGPLALADLIGLDVCLAILEVLHQEMGAGRYRPSPLLRRYVDAGWLGRKTGRGFYRYDAPAAE